MAQVDVINKENKSVGTLDMPDDIFGVTVKKGLLYEVVRNHLANRRQGTAATKTKGMVSGGGKKPYRQKGTGRARAGSNRSPLWRGGGTTFGPQPRDYSYRIQKKVKWAALSSALSGKLSDGEVIVVDQIAVPEPKTRVLSEFLTGLGIERSVLIVIPEKNENLERAAQNLPGVHISRVSELNVYSVMTHDRLLVTKDSVAKMQEVYLG